MRMPLRSEPWPPGAHAPRECPVCWDYWRPWAGSYLPCHGRCLFTEDEQDALLDEDRTAKAQAQDHGVTQSVIRAALGAAMKRRKHDG